MTVKELIKELSILPGDANVQAYESYEPNDQRTGLQIYAAGFSFKVKNWNDPKNHWWIETPPINFEG